MSKRKKLSKKKSKLPSKTRSGFEDQIIKQLKSQRVPFDYETEKLSYTLHKNYLVDIILPNGIIVELKGLFDLADRNKMLAVKKANPTKDIRIVFQADNYVNNLSKEQKKKRLDIRTDNGKITKEEIQELNKNRMKYSDWCVKHGFKYAIGKIPTTWLDE